MKGVGALHRGMDAGAAMQANPSLRTVFTPESNYHVIGSFYNPSHRSEQARRFSRCCIHLCTRQTSSSCVSVQYAHPRTYPTMSKLVAATACKRAVIGNVQQVQIEGRRRV